jgi:hypothetical protein
MLEPEEVSAMLRLNELEWGTKRIARELRISRNTVELHRGWRLDAIDNRSARKRSMARRLGCGHACAVTRQCRRDPSGGGHREGHHRQPAHGGAGSAALSAGVSGGSAGDGPGRHEELTALVWLI